MDPSRASSSSQSGVCALAASAAAAAVTAAGSLAPTLSPSSSSLCSSLSSAAPSSSAAAASVSASSSSSSSLPASTSFAAGIGEPVLLENHTFSQRRSPDPYADCAWTQPHAPPLTVSMEPPRDARPSRVDTVRSLNSPMANMSLLAPSAAAAAGGARSPRRSLSASNTPRDYHATSPLVHGRTESSPPDSHRKRKRRCRRRNAISGATSRHQRQESATMSEPGSFRRYTPLRVRKAVDADGDSEMGALDDDEDRLGIRSSFSADEHDGRSVDPSSDEDPGLDDEPSLAFAIAHRMLDRCSVDDAGLQVHKEQRLRRLLGASDFFGDSTEELISLIINVMQCRQLQQGEPLFDANDDRFYILDCGALKDGRGHKYSSGACFGEASLMHMSPKSPNMQVTCTSPGRVWFVAGDEVRGFVQEHQRDKYAKVCEFLRHFLPWLKPGTHEHQLIADKTRLLTKHQGDLIAEAFSRPDSLYVVREGRVSVLFNNRSQCYMGPMTCIGSELLDVHDNDGGEDDDDDDSSMRCHGPGGSDDEEDDDDDDASALDAERGDVCEDLLPPRPPSTPARQSFPTVLRSPDALSVSSAPNMFHSSALSPLSSPASSTLSFASSTSESHLLQYKVSCDSACCSIAAIPLSALSSDSVKRRFLESVQTTPLRYLAQQHQQQHQQRQQAPFLHVAMQPFKPAPHGFMSMTSPPGHLQPMQLPGDSSSSAGFSGSRSPSASPPNSGRLQAGTWPLSFT